MKTAVAVLLLVGGSFAQSSSRVLNTKAALAMYHANEKRPGVGFLSWLIIPGGGEFYAGKPIVGSVFAAAEIGAVILVAGHTNQNARATYLALFSFVKLGELFATMSDIHNYNHELKIRLGLQETPVSYQPGIQLSLSF